MYTNIKLNNIKVFLILYCKYSYSYREIVEEVGEITVIKHLAGNVS